MLSKFTEFIFEPVVAFNKMFCKELKLKYLLRVNMYLIELSLAQKGILMLDNNVNFRVLCVIDVYITVDRKDRLDIKGSKPWGRTVLK